MSIQNERQAGRRQESRCCGEYARIRVRGFRDRQSDELVEFFLPHSLSRKSDIAKGVPGGVDQDRTNPNSLLLLFLFLWDRGGRGRFAFFLFLANHFGSSDSLGFSHNRVLFHCWGENRKCG